MSAPLKPPSPPRPERVEKQLRCTQQARAFARAHFDDLRTEVLRDRRPYVLSSAEMPHEIFDTLGLKVVTSEWWGGVLAAAGRAPEYLDWAEAHGFHDDLGAYNALGLLSLIADVDDPPWGGLPKPALICASHREQTAEPLNGLVADRLGVPYVGIDIPASTRFYPRWWEMARTDWEDLYESRRIDVVRQQYDDLVRTAERIAGKSLDTDALRARMERVNRQELNFDMARELIATAPRCPVRISEQMSNVMTAQWHRGSDWAVNHSLAFYEEVRERIDRHESVYAEERIRLMWIGVGLWHNTAFYSGFEKSHGAVFVWSMYLALAADAYIKFGLRDPLRALAARYLNLGEQAHAAPWAPAWLLHEAHRHNIHGAVLLRSPKQRHQLAGNVFQKAALEEANIPVLELTVDPSDSRGWDEVSMRSTVGDFLNERVHP